MPSFPLHTASNVCVQTLKNSRVNFQLDLVRKKKPEFFTEAEWRGIQTHPQPGLRYASTLAGKKAVSKVLAENGCTSVRFPEIEIGHDEAGAPFIEVSPQTASSISDYGIEEIAVSMSNDGGITASSAVALPPGDYRSSQTREDHIAGVGIDIVAYEHLSEVFNSYWQPAIQHMFTADEIREASLGLEESSIIKQLSAIFAGKEAVFKSFSRILRQERQMGRIKGEAEPDIREIEILNVTTDRPRTELAGATRQIAGRQGVSQIRLKYTFKADVVVALAICVRS